jgi:hypothetical protein
MKTGRRRTKGKRKQRRKRRRRGRGGDGSDARERSVHRRAVGVALSEQTQSRRRQQL